MRDVVNERCSEAMETADTHRAIDAVWRIESPRLIAGLVRIVRDVGLAEDLAHDALVAALEQWPERGVPRNPGAWLMATAKHRAIDLFRRNKLLERKHETLGYELDAQQSATPDFAAAIDDDVGDDLLRLVFTACHPVLSIEARIALTLRLLGGLTTDEIARAILGAGTDYRSADRPREANARRQEGAVEVPSGSELEARLSSVLERRVLDLQRRLCGDGRRRLDETGALRRRPAVRDVSWRSWHRANLKCMAWSR